MRAEMEKIHRGKVDDATLARIGEMSSVSNAFPAQSALISVNYQDSDQAAIARYLAAPHSAPDTAGSAPLHLAQAAVPVATYPPSMPMEGRSYVGLKICSTAYQQEAANWAHTIHASVRSRLIRATTSKPKAARLAMAPARRM